MNNVYGLLTFISIFFVFIILTLFLYFGWISNNKTVLEILFVLIVICLGLYIYFNGCIITKLERKLSNSDFTVVDPLLTSLGIKIDKNLGIISLSFYTS